MEKQPKLDYSNIKFKDNGKLKLRGKYSNNQPKGTWKYYSEEGDFDGKEKF